MVGMREMADNSVDLTLTDIPYGVVNSERNGIETKHTKKIAKLDVGAADKLTFDLQEFCNEVYRVTKGTIIIFCSREQISFLCEYFKDKKGVARALIWKKTNSQVFNGHLMYLSDIEWAFYFRSPNSTFNGFCKSCVFEYGTQQNQIHPTEKSHKLLAELIADNSNEGDLVFDPCAGSGSTLLVARKGLRRIKGFELNKDFYDKALARLNFNNSIFGA